MPPIARYLVRAAIVCFAAGVTTGVIGTFYPIPPPVYYHLLLFGWVTQMIMGVSLWMFPKRENDQGNWILLLPIFVNAGLLLRVLGETSEPAYFLRPIFLLTSALLQWLGAVMYVILIWGRIR